VRPELDDTATAAPQRLPSVRSTGLPAGQQLGHFRIERPLGAGGMGEVYLATDLALDRPVALKVLPDGVAKDPGRRDRMVREARAQARVVHPNVGHIYFIGEQDGRLYFAMEYVAGYTLAERVAKGPVPVEEALALIRSAALGLREAQRSGFTHRDVKPSNLMVDAHGVLKVLDFGLAAGDPHAATDGPVAQTSLAGTPLYMAPEQARGEPVDFRADIYALGATLYHLVAGTPPFQAETVEELNTLHAKAARPALPRKGKPRTAVAAIDTLCAKMMAPSPADRYASYDELLHALELASVAHTRPAGFWARTIAAGLDLVIVMIGVAFVEWLVALLTDREGPNAGPIFTGALLYTTVVVARWGKTPAKALFELEVVDLATGARPSWRQSALRALVMLGPPTMLAWTSSLAHELASPLISDLTGIVAGAWFGLCGALLLHAAARVPGKRPPWDRVAKTMVRYRTQRITPL